MKRLRETTLPAEYMQEIGVGLRLRVVQRGPSQSLLRYEPPAPGFPAETVISNSSLVPIKDAQDVDGEA